MTEPAMIERMTQALRTEIDGQDGWSGSIEFEPLARAVITAMREPTEAAIDIGIFKMRSGGPMSPDERVTAIWEAMIDAALEDGK